MAPVVPAPPSQTQEIGSTQIIPSPAVGVARSVAVTSYAVPEAVTTSTVPWVSVRIEDDVPEVTPNPTRIAIAAIDVDAPVVALGVTPDTGQMEVPENVNEVGWYRHGPSPGLSGSAVLAAHVDMFGEGPGVFFHLDRLRSGDRIDVTLDNGTVVTFIVTTTERVAKATLDINSIFASEGQPLLRLVTCGGGFNRTIRGYEDNVVVTAKLEDA